MKLIYERSQPGRRASALPAYENLPVPPELPEELRRSEPPRLPEVPEFELVRHFTELSTRNFGVDTGFYPLGSCTMKYNPRINERLAALPGFARLHPLQDEDGAQGALELMWRLQEILAEVTGLDAVSLQPAAGSQGELTGLLLARAYFAARGEGEQRRKVVIPDTAHGTNPASVTMAGYELTPVRTDARGNIDVDDLRGKVDGETAALMLTNPSTLGLFDENIEEIERDLPRRRRAHVLRRREPQRGVRDLAPRRHGLRHRPHQPAQDVLAAARRRRPGRRADRGAQDARAVPARACGRAPGRRRLRARLRPAADDRQGARLHRAVRRLRPLVRVPPDVGAAPARDVRGGRAQRELRPRAAEGRLRPAVRPPLHARVRDLGAHAEAGSRRHRARRREAADGLRLPSADRLLPTGRSRGADGRADRDRGERDARRVLRRDARDRAGGGRGAGAAEGGSAPPAGEAARRGSRGEAAGCQVRLRGREDAGRRRSGHTSPAATSRSRQRFSSSRRISWIRPQPTRSTSIPGRSGCSPAAPSQPPRCSGSRRASRRSRSRSEQGRPPVVRSERSSPH